MPNRAAAVAVATPCWPAPVSAMSRRLPIRRASRPWPIDVVDLVRAGVGQVLALQQDPDPELLGQPAALGDRGRPAAVVAQDAVELGPEGRVGPGVTEGRLELDAGRHQRLGDVAAAELAEPAGRAGVAHDPEASGSSSGPARSESPDVPSIGGRPGTLADGHASCQSKIGALGPPVPVGHPPSTAAASASPAARRSRGAYRVLHPGRRLDPARHVHAPRVEVGDGPAHVVGAEPAGDHEPGRVDHPLGQAPVEQLARPRGWRRRSAGSGRRTRRTARCCGGRPGRP